MKKLLTVILPVAFLVFGLFSSVWAQEEIKIFVGEGCLHCAKVEKYVSDNNLQNKLNIKFYEIYSNKENALLFNQICDQKGIPLTERGVPMLIKGDKYILGDRPIIEFLAQYDSQGDQGQFLDETTKQNKSNNRLTLPMVISAAAVDAINPCAFAVLIILLTTILASSSRKKALLTGISFAASIFISYFLMGLGLYSALATVGLSDALTKVIAALAVILGILNVKDFFWYGGGGFLMEVPQRWRPKLKMIIRSVTSPFGAFLIGFLVSLFLLPCTSGPYIVILGMLSQRATFVRALPYLALYNLIFVSPMILIALAVYCGLSPNKAEEIRQKNLRIFHLIAGVILIGMGIFLLF